MECLVLCCDYDGTVANEGVLTATVVAALEKFNKSGRRAVLVTGRRLEDLQQVCPRLDLFARVVAENGAVLYDPATHEMQLLAEPPLAELAQKLRARVDPIDFGHVIIATREPHDRTVLDIIRMLGLEWQVIFNKGAVMVLPAGVNKASGVAAALDALSLSARNAVAVGDAENDHALIASCEWGVAVANALPTLKDHADFVTQAACGAGVTELIEEIVTTDLATRDAVLSRHHIVIGRTKDNVPVAISPHRFNALLLGSSGGGKTTASLSLLERFVEKGYSFCVIDPEGDYEMLENVALLGAPEHPPDLDELRHILDTAAVNTVVSLVGVALDERPLFFANLVSRIKQSRGASGLPHLILVDEAHHVSPIETADNDPLHNVNALRVTVHPHTLAHAVLNNVRVVISLGSQSHERLQEFAIARGVPAPHIEATELNNNEAWVWRLDQPEKPQRVTLIPSTLEHRRHTRKYAEGELPLDRSFFFRGPEHKLNLRAQNLSIFLQLADGVDDATWIHHLQQHDYSRWISDELKDPDLAREISTVESRATLSSRESRTQIRKLIETRYTASSGKAV
jgi:HAD superfamily hydrolase (TIGR01484 family)